MNNVIKDVVMRVFLCVLVFGFCSLYAGLADYQFNYTEGEWQELTEGNFLGNEQTDNQYFVNPDYPFGVVAASISGIGIAIGFDFFFDGELYDRFGVCADGWIALGKSIYENQAVILSRQSSTLPPLSYTLSHNTTEDRIARIAGFARDLQAQAGATLRHSTIGNAPLRILVVEWKNYSRKDFSGDNLNFQIRLHEGSNKVEIVFGQMQVGGISSGQIGMRSLPATLATNYACRSTNNGYHNSVAGTNASALAALTPTNRPAVGASFSWTPIASIVPEFIALPQSGFAPLTVQFTDQSAGDEAHSWNWDFGDGSSSTLQNPVHTYTSPGTYSVSLAVNGGQAILKNNFIQVFERPAGTALNLTMQGYDAHLSWEHIHSDANGNPFQPTYYFLYFNGSANPDGEFYFLAPIEYPNQSYIHQGVGRGAKHIFYKLKAIGSQ